MFTTKNTLKLFTKNSNNLKIKMFSNSYNKYINSLKHFGSIRKILFNDIGEGTTDGNIVQYFVKEGETVKEDQPVVEISILKNTAKVQSPDNGIVKKIHFKTGDPIKVGQTLVEIETEGENDNEKNNDVKSEQISNESNKLENKNEKITSCSDVPFEKCELFLI